MFRLKHNLLRYWKGRSGATMMAFALTIPVIVGAMGVAVDIGRSYLEKERLTHALDAAALAGAGSANLSQSELADRINAYFRKNYRNHQNITLNIEQDGDILRVAASSEMDTSFMRVLGISEVQISGNTVVQRQVRGVEVALVLDVTGSMATNNNIGALRTAATSFTDILCPGTDCSNLVRIGLVPFATSVNVGPYGLGKNPDGTTYDTAFVNNPSNLQFKQSGSGSTTAWWGCILEQNPNNDVVDSQDNWKWNMYRYVSNSGSTTAPNTNCNKAYILPLTAKKATIKSRISTLTASGNTLSNIGMVWGYRVLSPNAPFREGAPFHDDQIKKVVVMMTDGDNNIGNSYSAYGPWANLHLTDTNLDQKLATTCTNMKNDGIKVYTITFTSDITNATKNYYRNCATDPNKYYDAPTQAELIDVFQRIAAELSNLYVTQ